MEECWHGPDLGCGIVYAPPTHEQQPAVSACDVHTFASHQVLEARKMRDYVNLAQLELRSLDSLSCMLPGAGWPQEKCAQGWRSGNKAQAIPYRRSLRATSSHTRSQRLTWQVWGNIWLILQLLMGLFLSFFSVPFRGQVYVQLCHPICQLLLQVTCVIKIGRRPWEADTVDNVLVSV